MKSFISNSNKLRVGALVVSSVLLGAGSGCSKNTTSVISNIVTNVGLSSSVVDSNDWIQLNVTLSTGNYTLAGINLPVTDPNDPTKEYGQFTMTSVLCPSGKICAGGGTISIALNITAISSVNGVSNNLPNGTAIPVSGLTSSTLVAIPIANTGAKIYFAFGPNVALLGTAVPFSALDPAGKYANGVDIFAPFTIGPVSLTAGMFFGSTTNTTGVGLFVDLSGVINSTTGTASSFEMARSSDFTQAWSSSMRGGAFQSDVKLLAVEPSSRMKTRIFTDLYNMSNRGGVLRVKE